MRSRAHVFLAAAGALVSLLSLVAAQEPPARPTGPIGGPSAPEPRLRDIKQLTFGGENAEAYFSPDGKQLIFQATRDGGGCDQHVRDERRRQRRAPRVVRSGAHDLRLLHAGWKADRLRQHPRRRRRVSAQAVLRARLRLAHLRHLRHLPGERRRQRPEAAHHDAGLRRRSDDRLGRAHRLHQRARRRHGHLLDERRRLGRPPADRSRRSGRRSVLVPRRAADRLPWPADRARQGAGRLSRPAEAGAVAAHVAGVVRDEPGRVGTAAGDKKWRSELRAVLHARWPPDRLRVEHAAIRAAATSTSIW